MKIIIKQTSFCRISRFFEIEIKDESKITVKDKFKHIIKDSYAKLSVLSKLIKYKLDIAYKSEKAYL